MFNFTSFQKKEESFDILPKTSSQESSDSKQNYDTNEAHET